MSKPILSIVIPTLGEFSEDWLSQVLKVKGTVEFVFVYPPNSPIKRIDDPRIKVIVSPYEGEMMQTCIGLLNASGEYVLGMSDRSLAHENIVELTEQYFHRFPESLMVRLKKEEINNFDSCWMKQNWDVIPPIQTLDICKKTRDNPHPFQRGDYSGLLEISIVPLTNRFDIRYALCFLKNKRSWNPCNIENFSYKIWKKQVVTEPLTDLLKGTRLMEVITWIPSAGFERLLGLFVQAKFFHRDAIIGHWMPKPAQIRQLKNTPVTLLRRPRLHVLSDVILVIRYPQYGYFWNLFFNQLHQAQRTVIKALKEKLLGKRS